MRDWWKTTKKREVEGKADREQERKRSQVNWKKKKNGRNDANGHKVLVYKPISKEGKGDNKKGWFKWEKTKD